MRAESRAEHLIVWAAGEARRLRLAATPTGRRRHTAGAGVAVSGAGLGASPATAAAHPSSSPSSSVGGPRSLNPALSGMRHSDVRCHRSGDDALVEVSGELDGATAPELDQHLMGVSDAPRVVVDLQQVTFMDSHGLVLLVSALENARTAAGRAMVLRSPSKSVRRVFDLCGIDRVFDAEPTRTAEEARHSRAGGGA